MSRAVKVVFSGDMSKLRAAVLRARQTIRKFAVRAKAAMRAVGKSIKNISFSALRKGALAAGAALAGIAAGGIKGVKLAADMETLTTSFEVLTGSAEVAKKTIKDLDDLSNSTPLAPEDVISAGQQLIAFGENASTVTATVARLGDVSSGIGAPLGDIAEIYGKARVQGTLFSEDINQLAGRGVPIFESLASVMGVAAGDIKKMASEGKIGFKQLEQSFIQMTSSGGKFEGMMAKQSQTFNGMLSTMFGKLRAKLRDAFTPVMENLKPILESVIAKIDSMTPRISQVAKSLGDVVKITAAVFAQGKLLSLGGSMLKVALIEGANVLWRVIRSSVAFLSTGLRESAKLLDSMLTNESFIDGLLATFRAGAALLKAAAYDIAAALLERDDLSNLANSYRFSVEVESNIAKNAFSRSGVGDGLVSVLKKATSSATKFFSGVGLISSASAKSEVATQLNGIRESLEAQRAASKDSPTAAVPANTTPAASAKAAEKSAGIIADSKARVGGGGRVFSADNRAFAEQRRQTVLQERTAKATETMAKAPTPSTLTATYA